MGFGKANLLCSFITCVFIHNRKIFSKSEYLFCQNFEGKGYTIYFDGFTPVIFILEFK